MQLFVSELLGSMVQVIIFLLIPGIWWLLTARNEQNFGHWIGFRKFKGGKSLAIWILFTIIGFWFVGSAELYSLKNVATATSAFTGLGISALPAIIVYAVFHTSLTEELLFRGFLLKRLSHKFGFALGNAVQALLFGLIHGVLLYSVGAGAAGVVSVTAFAASIAWAMGYINEKKASGSIYPGWIIHGTVNIIAGLCAALLG